MKELPLGLTDFKDVIEGGFVYVDKTKWVYELVKKKGYNFLSRPRRFGKSLLLSTIEHLFKGHRELFRGAGACGSVRYDWVQRPQGAVQRYLDPR